MSSRRARLPVVFIGLLTSVVLVMATLPGAAAAAIPAARGVEYLSSIGGAVRSLAVAAGRAYLGEGDSLRVLDVSDRADIREIGRLEMPADDIQLAGGYAYVRGQGVSIVDVRDPARPALASTYHESVVDMVVVGNRLYVAGATYDATGAPVGGFLRVLDVSVPTAPTVRASYTALPGAAEALEVANNRAYVAYFKARPQPQPALTGIAILDLAPSTPALLGTVAAYTDLYSVNDLQVAGTSVYLLAGEPDGRTLLVFDASDASKPKPINAMYMPETLGDTLRVSGDYLYLARRDVLRLPFGSYHDPNLYVITRSSLDTPNLTELPYVDRVQIRGTVATIVLAGSLVYLGDKLGFEVVDVSHPARGPRVVARFDGLAFPRALALRGNRAYVAGDGDLTILNITNPLSPTLAGSYPVGAIALDLADTTAYLATTNPFTDLLLLDVTDVARPLPLGEYSTPNSVERVRVQDQRAFLGVQLPFDPLQKRSLYALEIVNVQAPANPVLLGRYEIASELRDLDVEANRAYLVSSAVYSETAGAFVGGELEILDVSDPAHPARLGALAGDYEEVQVAGNLAYLRGAAGLMIVDVSDPAYLVIAGVLLSRDHEPGEAYQWSASAGMHVVGSRVYAGGGNLAIIDAADPIRPALLGTTGSVYSTDFGVVRVAGDYAYGLGLASGSLSIADVRDPRSLRTVGASSSTGDVRTGEIDGARVYLLGDSVSAVDISDPLAPSLFASTGSWERVRGERPYDLDVEGGRVYVATGERVRIFDQALNPVEHADLLAAGVSGVKVAGDVAYLSYGNGLLGVMELATGAEVTALTGVGEFVAASTQVVGNLLFLSSGAILDISNRRAPTVAGRLPVRDAKVAGTRAYAIVTSDESGPQGDILVGSLAVFDVSDPTTPALLGSYRACSSPYTAPGHVADLTGKVVNVAAGQVYIDCNGLQLIDARDPAQPRLQATLGGHADFISGDIAVDLDGSVELFRLRPAAFNRVLLPMVTRSR